MASNGYNVETVVLFPKEWLKAQRSFSIAGGPGLLYFAGNPFYEKNTSHVGDGAVNSHPFRPGGFFE
jgi:hypothetical protein